MTAPMPNPQTPSDEAVEAALNSEYCTPELREHWPAGYRDEQRERMAKRLTAAMPALTAQIRAATIAECVGDVEGLKWAAVQIARDGDRSADDKQAALQRAKAYGAVLESLHKRALLGDATTRERGDG